MIRLTAKQESNLLSIHINREVNIDQVHLIKQLLELTDEATPNELAELDEWLAGTIALRDPHPGGIEQYQDESR